jgi:CRISPR-associated protein Csb2
MQQGVQTNQGIPLPAGSAPQALRWRVMSQTAEQVLPPLEAALPFTRAARNAFMSNMAQHGLTELPDGFHHAQAGEDSAFWLADDEDGDGLIDHLLCVRHGGLEDALLPLLAGGGNVWLSPAMAASLGWGKDLTWQLSACWMGRIGPGGLFGPARRWTSQTPYLPPREALRGAGHGRGQSGQMRPGRTPEAQLLKDIAQAGLPAPLGIGMSPVAMRGGRMIHAADMLVPPAPQGRAQLKLPPPGCIPGFATVVFPQPVFGPIALGFGAHGGLGLFEPVPEG